MREHLFRAKTVKNQWVKGDLVHFPNIQGAVIFPANIDFADVCIGFEKGEPIIDCNYIVIPETVCQFTGAYFDNGDMLWEKDIVYLAKPDGHFTVEYNLDDCCFIFKSIDTNEILSIYGYFDGGSILIGNTIDNQ